MINLVNDTIDKQDIDALINWLQTNPRLTKGPLTVEFEQKFAEWLGAKYAVFVNSGSSANLIMLYALIEQGILDPHDSNKCKVVVPALSWATDLSPVLQFGLTPILCDCNLKDLSVDLQMLEMIFKDSKPQALLLVSILGLSPDMNAICDLCTKYGVVLLEDNCESLGTTYNGNKLGLYGHMSTTSFYFGHHISTIEGGMVFTDHEETYNILLALRSHGWSRDWSPEHRETMETKHQIEGINSLYTFYHPGFNVRATDLQAFLGLRQLDKLDSIIEKRYTNFNLYLKYLAVNWVPIPVNGSMTSNFAFPIIMRHKNKLIQALAQNNIETRPLVAGSLAQQPMYTIRYGTDHDDNWNTREVHKHGIYLPNHPGLTEADIKMICEVVNSI